MQHIQAPFQIYSASAGSGKTFLLVQKYLSRLLSGRNDEYFSRLMALTFTNKAVFEMKYRILLQLHTIATAQGDLENHPMSNALMTTLSVKPAELQLRAKSSLKAILHDYAAFDVITLDSFTHRVIRTFAKDLGLAYNFDVALDVDGFLEEIVNRMFEQVGPASDLTQLLEEFTFEKMDDEATTSWELKQNLMASAKLLLNENDRNSIQQIARLSAKQRHIQHAFLQQHQKALVKKLKTIGQEMLLLFLENGLEASHFTRKTLFNRFSKLAVGDFKDFDEGKLYENMLAGKPLYPKKVAKPIQECIEGLSSTILTHFEKALEYYHQWLLVKDIRKQWIPLSLVTALAKELDAYQSETNRVLLSTFNERIAREILHQPTPYIYERLGENYRHYFLDEFQDTSSLQWENLIPLIETPLESLNADDRTGSLLLVGDPKQSIYRWRGGNVDQFIGLIEEENPFNVPKKVNDLGVNYRSARNIVAFNNALYTSLPEQLVYEENKDLFGSRAQQEISLEKEGYVKLCFFEDEKPFDENPYAKRVIEEINHCIDRGYTTADMVVLVRKKKQADSIAKAFAKANILSVTATSLKLEENDQVRFLASLLQLYNNPKDLMVKKTHLCFLYSIKEREEDLHHYLLTQIKKEPEKIWLEEGIAFNFSFFDHRDLSTILEKACFLFPGIAINNPYVSAFLDLVFDFCQKEEADPQSFLHFWEAKKEEQSLSLPEESEGVRILTIHQAKGLEFPIVFFPYADSLIQSNQRDKVWLSTQSMLGDAFPLAWVGFSKRLLKYGAIGEQAYHKKRQEEELDAWNVCYVATTRASEQMYLFANDKNKNKESYVKTFFALDPEEKHQEEKQCFYTWGKPPFSSNDRPTSFFEQSSNESEENKTMHPYEQQLILQMARSEAHESARLLGLRIHELLGRIHYADEVGSILDEAYIQGDITAEEQYKLTQLFEELTQKDAISDYFTRKYKVLNEKAILLPGQRLLRPDRVGVGEEDAFVIDYKTGKEKPEHTLQLFAYAKWVEKITSKKVNPFLVYLDIEANKKVKVRQLS